MADFKFIDGLSVWEPSKNAPDFIVCNITANVDKLVAFLQANKNEAGGIRIAVKKGKSGKYYAQLDTYQIPKEDPSVKKEFNNVKDELKYPADVLDPADIPF